MSLLCLLQAPVPDAAIIARGGDPTNTGKVDCSEIRIAIALVEEKTPDLEFSSAQITALSDKLKGQLPEVEVDKLDALYKLDEQSLSAVVCADHAPPSLIQEFFMKTPEVKVKDAEKAAAKKALAKKAKKCMPWEAGWSGTDENWAAEMGKAIGEFKSSSTSAFGNRL